MTAASASPERLLEALDERQREVAQTLLGPVCVLAGAGTGKTRAITHRIAYGVATGAYDPARVMALTFTTRAAGELLGRLRALGADGVAARTFHSAALRQLHYFWPTAVGGTPPRVLDAKGPVLGQAAGALKLGLDTAALRDAAAEIEWRKVSRLSIDAYALAAESRTLPARLSVDAMVALQRHYESIKDDRKQIDFEDVLLATAGMIEAEPRVADQVRAQYRFFVVDEYQDVSPLQHDLLSLWLGGRRELCVVGDASQTIYSFAGATSDYLVRFGSEYPEARVVRLEDNYRSTTPIVTLANRLMRGRPGALTLHAASDAGEVRGPTPSTTRHVDDAAEAASIAQSIARRQSVLRPNRSEASDHDAARGLTLDRRRASVQERERRDSRARVVARCARGWWGRTRKVGEPERPAGPRRGFTVGHLLARVRARASAAPTTAARAHPLSGDPCHSARGQGPRMGGRVHRWAQ